MSIVPDRPEPLTLAEFLPVWHEAYGKDLAPRTQQTYAVVWDKWIGPRLGGRLLLGLTLRELVRFRVDVEADGAGAQTIAKVLTVLGSVLSEPVRQGQIAASRTRAISRPKQDRVERCARRRRSASRSSALAWRLTSTERS